MAKQNPADKKEKKSHNLLRFLEGFLVGKEKEAWKKIEEKFDKEKVDGKLFKDKFGACIGINENSKDFACELFDVLAKRNNIESANGITLPQLKEFWKELTSTNLNSRLEIFFDLCDKNDDHKISMEEVKTVLEWTAIANKLTNIKEDIESYASLIVRGLDPDGNGFIEFEHMKHFIKELWDSKEDEKQSSQNESSSSFKEIEMIVEKWKRIWVFTLWLAINFGLFVWKFMEYKDKEAFQVMGYCACAAKGSAETLKFNMGLILFLACRGTLTKLRSTFLSSRFPFDDHIYFHTLVGAAISVATFVHMIMHLGCGFPKLTSCPINKLREILGPSFEFKQPSYSDLVASVPGVTGILMVIIMAYCFTLAIPSLRNKKSKGFFRYLIGFNGFWYAHHLLFLVYVLLILHGYFISLAWDWLKRTTWLYIAFPLLLYASERLAYKKVNVKEAVVYRGNAQLQLEHENIDLLALSLEKPKGFKYESGMYLSVNCPDISYFEWHPFSITSAPGDDNLNLHIRSAGDWTNDIINRFEKMKCKACGHESKQLDSSYKYPQIFIKGPYGAPAQNYKDFDILLLLGFGVGATPMISILKDVLNHIKTNAPQSESAANHTVHDSRSPPTGDAPKVPKKAYFYWVTRTQESFEWFKRMMNDVADHDTRKVIEMHNHLSGLKEGDARSLFFTILQKIQREKDVISIKGSGVRARFGRPDWEDVFSNLESSHKGSNIGVFYCGSFDPREFERLCREHSQDSTKFHFHNENF